MIGTSLALGFTLAMSFNSIITRRGVLRASVSYVANISIWSGPLFFLVMALITGDIFNLGRFRWQAYVFFAMSGIIHFVMGRTFGYRSIQMIGSTRSNVVSGMSAIVTVILAVTVLNEKVTPLMALGILLSLLGPLLIAYKEQFSLRSVGATANRAIYDVDQRTLYLGLLFGLGSAVFWGSSGIFIKLGLEAGGSSIVGSLTAYVAASLAILPMLFNRSTRTELFSRDSTSLQLALLTGLSTNVGQLLRFMALEYASLISVSLVMRTQPIWVLMLAFIFNRKLESFGPWVLVGNGLLLIGTILVIM